MKPKTDYCTCWFDKPFFRKDSWSGCCWKHDEQCLLSHEYRSAEMRLKADRELYQCVKAKGYPINAMLMYIGVRAWYWTKWRWVDGIKFK